MAVAFPPPGSHPRSRGERGPCSSLRRHTGVMRHADAGYAKAIEVAKAKGLNMPMLNS